MSEQKKELIDNKGFTILELLVVLAVVAIVTSLAGISLSIVNNANVSKAATRFDSMLSRARSESIARGTDAGQLVITYENGNVYGQIGNFEKELICNGQIKVYIGDVAFGGTSPYEETGLFDSTDLYLMNDGANASVTFRFSPSGIALTNDTGTYTKPCKLLFERNNKKVEVVLYRQTGKHEVKAF